jgi:hypothetical protein
MLLCTLAITQSSDKPTTFTNAQLRSFRLKLYRAITSGNNDQHLNHNLQRYDHIYIGKPTSQLKQFFQTFQYWHQSADSTTDKSTISTLDGGQPPNLLATI